MSSNQQSDENSTESNTEKKVDIKQRIIGAIILVSLGVIFIPLILNGGSGNKVFVPSNNIPDVPEKLKRTFADSPQPEDMPPTKKIVAYPSDVKAGVKGQTPIKAPTNRYEKATQPTKDEINTAYAIQIASFGKKSNAVDLQNKLRKKGFKAYIELITTEKGYFYRLRVGPSLNFKQLAATQKKLEANFKLKKTVLVKYTVK